VTESTASGFAGVLGQGSRNGVYGRSSSATDSGVYGENTGGGFGVAGVTTSAFPVAAVWGNNSGAGVAVRGTSFGGGLAGYFEGDVAITGAPGTRGQAAFCSGLVVRALGRNRGNPFLSLEKRKTMRTIQMKLNCCFLILGTWLALTVLAAVPGHASTNILQILYRGPDLTVRSMWRNPDGSWSGEQNLGGSAYGYITVAQVPGTNCLQIFYSGPDTTVRSRWRNPDGSWSYELNLGGSGAYSNIATAVVP
jgi:hypothetical protein